MIGRTHGVHAEPMTFGLKMALWHAELQRQLARLDRARANIAHGKLSGAVGTFSHLPPEVEEAVCARLGLLPAPASSQVLQRDRHAEVMTTLALIAASLEKFATEIRALQKTEVREVEEPFGSGQKGSSAMPHKRNPVGCEQVAGLARLVRTNALASLENVALWHERDISHSSVERVIVPDSFLALDHMLARFTRIVKGMTVDEARMRRNLDLGQGLVFSGRLLLELTAKGMRREDAYRVVQAHAMEAWKSEGDFRQRVLADPEVREVLSEAEIEEVFRLERYLTHVDAVFDRVFGSEARALTRRASDEVERRRPPAIRGPPVGDVRHGTAVAVPFPLPPRRSLARRSTTIAISGAPRSSDCSIGMASTRSRLTTSTGASSRDSRSTQSLQMPWLTAGL